MTQVDATRRPGGYIAFTVTYLSAIVVLTGMAYLTLLGYCDERSAAPGEASTCRFLSDGGYALVTLVPLVVVGAAALLAAFRPRARILHVSFALAAGSLVAVIVGAAIAAGG